MIAMYFEPKAMKLKTVFMETYIFFLTWLDFIITFTNRLFGLSWGRGTSFTPALFDPTPFFTGHLFTVKPVS